MSRLTPGRGTARTARRPARRPRRLRRSLRPAGHAHPARRGRHLGDPRLAHRGRVHPAPGRVRGVRPRRHLALHRAGRRRCSRSSRVACSTPAARSSTSSPSSTRRPPARSCSRRLLRFARFKGAAGRLRRAVRRTRRPPLPHGARAGSASCARRAPGRRCRPARSLAPSACCSPSRPRPTCSHITDIAVTLVAELRRLRDLLAAERELHVLGGGAARPAREGRDVLRAARAAQQRRGEPAAAAPFAEITVTRAAAAAGPPRGLVA